MKKQKSYIGILCLCLLQIIGCVNQITIQLPDFHQRGGHIDWRSKLEDVSINMNGQIFINSELTKLTDLQITPKKDNSIIIKADRNISFDKLNPLLKRLKSLGFSIVYFAIANDPGYKNAVRVYLKGEKKNNQLLLQFKDNNEIIVTLQDNDKVVSHGTVKMAILKQNNYLSNVFSHCPEKQAIIVPAKNTTHQNMMKIFYECREAGCYNLHIGEL
jgi:biopolymer transport protein ExbD